MTLLASLVVPLCWLAQSDASTPVLHAQARVVQVDVVVTDSKGKPVRGLSKEDFQVKDEGKTRAIDIFSANDEAAASAPAQQGPPLPPNVYSNRNATPAVAPGHTTVIVLDQLNVARDPNRSAFLTAAANQLQVTSLMNKVRPDERIALYAMAKDEGLIILQDYTTDRQLLINALKNYIPRGMSTPPPAAGSSAKSTAEPGSPRRDPNAVSSRESDYLATEASSGTRLSLQALAEHLALVPGRKNVFMVRAEFPPLMMHGMFEMAWDKTISALNEANVAVNTLGEVADRTGGQSWRGRNDLDNALAEEIEASRTSYTLGFYLPDGERDDKYHNLDIKTLRPGLNVYSRTGYYAGESPLPKQAQTKNAELETALLNQTDSKDVGLTVRVDREKSTLYLSVDRAALSLHQQQGAWSGHVEETVIELSASGSTLGKISDKKEFVLDANDPREDISWPLSIPFASGALKIAVIVRDTASGRIGSLTIPLQ